MVGVCGVVTGYILSGFFDVLVGVATVKVDELQIVETAAEDFLCCFLGQAYLVGNSFDSVGIAFVLIHGIQMHDVPQVAVFMFTLDGEAGSHGADVVMDFFPHDASFVGNKRDGFMCRVGIQRPQDPKNTSFFDVKEMTEHGISLHNAHDINVQDGFIVVEEP